MTGWPLEIDGLEYQPIPEPWIDHGVDRGTDEPRIYAVSAAIRDRYDGRMLLVRYAHPRTPGVAVLSQRSTETADGIVPLSLVEHDAEWPRSIVPATDAQDVVRGPERQHMRDVWGERVDEIPSPESDADERGLIADGGRPADDIDRSAVDDEAIQEMANKEVEEPDLQKGISVRESGFEAAKNVKSESETWNELLINLVAESGRKRDNSDSGPVAWLCEVNTGDYGGWDGWREHVSRDHPSEVFNHVPYRNVRPLRTASEQSEGSR